MLEGPIALASMPPELGEQRLVFGRPLPPTRLEERGPGLLEHVLPGRFTAEERRPVAKEQGRSLGIVLGPELERGPVEPGRRPVGVKAEGAIPGLAQCRTRTVGDSGDVEPRRLRQIERADVVVGERLRVVLGPAERLDPLGRPPVALRSGRPRDLAVGDVSEQEMAERVLRLARDRGTTRPLDELLSLEPVQTLLDEP